MLQRVLGIQNSSRRGKRISNGSAGAVAVPCDIVSR
jgi:hypothetical protein